MSTNQKGFILYECLISLIIFSVVLTTLIQSLPQLLITKRALEHEQSIFHHLYTLKDQFLFHDLNLNSDLFYTDPIPYRVTLEQQTLCAVYHEGASNEKKLCL